MVEFWGNVIFELGSVAIMKIVKVRLKDIEQYPNQGYTIKCEDYVAS